MKTFRHRSWVLLAALVLAFVAASATRSAPLAAQPYKVMFIEGIGTAVNNYSTIPDAVAVATTAINKAGGIGGRPLQVTLCSHQGTTAGAVDCARQAIAGQFDNVIGINSVDTGSTPVLTAAGIPQIASYAQSAPDFQNPLNFALVAPPSAVLTADVAYAVKVLKLKRVAILGIDSAVTAGSNIPAVRTATQLVHGTWAGQVVIPTTTTDFAPYVQRLKDMNAQLVVVSVTNAMNPPFFQTALQLGLKARFAGSLTAVREIDLPNVPNNGEGLILGDPMPNWSQTSLPVIKAYTQQMRAAGKGDFNTISPNSTFYPWLALWALKDLSKTVKGAVTTPSMLAAARKANAKHPINIFGFTWTPGKKGPAAYRSVSAGRVWVTEVTGGKAIFKTEIDAWKVLGY